MPHSKKTKRLAKESEEVRAARKRNAEKKKAWQAVDGLQVVKGTHKVIDKNRPLCENEEAESITRRALFYRQPVKVIPKTGKEVTKECPLPEGVKAETITRGALSRRKSVQVVEWTVEITDERPLRKGEKAEIITRGALTSRRRVQAAKNAAIMAKCQRLQIAFFLNPVASEEVLPRVQNSKMSVQSLISQIEDEDYSCEQAKQQKIS